MIHNSLQIMHKQQRCFLLRAMSVLTPCDEALSLMEVSEEKNIENDKVEITGEWREFLKDQLLFSEK